MMKAIASSVICFLMFSVMCRPCSATETALLNFNETAARTGDVMTMLSIVALVAIMAFITFIIVIRSKRNKDPRE